jgi:NADH dehydrogenase (ubiquinone) 1 alpha subcomplex subunit 6
MCVTADFVSVKDFDVPITVPMGREKLREEFLKNKHVTDIRTIDLLVIKASVTT